jgi:hypothetical protein
VRAPCLASRARNADFANPDIFSPNSACRPFSEA